VAVTLTGKFLLATTRLLDPNFAQTVILLIRHDAQGAFGFVVNRPTDLMVADALGGVLDDAGHIDSPVYFGGPCQGPLFVLHRDAGIGGENPLPGVHLTTDRDAIEALLVAGAEPAKFFGTYSGWSPEQLETEIAEGSWLIYDGTADDAFSTDARLWHKLNARIHLSKYMPPERIPDDPSVN